MNDFSRGREFQAAHSDSPKWQQVTDLRKQVADLKAENERLRSRLDTALIQINEAALTLAASERQGS